MFSFLPGLAEQLTRQVETPDAARAAIAELDRERVDIVKLVLEPGFEDRPLPRLREDVFLAAMAEAKARKMRTTVHVGTDADARLAIEAGANGIEHTARGLSDETIALMAAKRVTFTPTNVVLDYAWKRQVARAATTCARRLAHAGDPAVAARSDVAAGAVPAGGRDMATRMAQAFAGSLDQTARAIRAGVPILAGSDAGNPVTFHGVSLIRELELLAQAGMPLGDVLQVGDVARGRSPGAVVARPHHRRRGRRPRRARRRSDRARRRLSPAVGGVSRRPQAGDGRTDRDLAGTVASRCTLSADDWHDRRGGLQSAAQRVKTPHDRTLRGLSWESYAWLIYSLPFLLAAFDSSFTARRDRGHARGVRGLPGCLLRPARSCAGRNILWLIAVMDLLVIAFGRLNPGTGSFLIYGAAMAAHAYPDPRRGDRAGRPGRRSAPGSSRCSTCRCGTT